MYNAIVINVDELWLKGKNRPRYFKALKQHIKEVVKLLHTDKTEIANENQRLVLKSETAFKEEVLEGLLTVPGIYSIAPARRVAPEFDAILPALVEELNTFETLPASFKVVTKRSEKNFPMSSMEISKTLGHLIRAKHFPDWPVVMKNQALTIDIKVLKNNIYISTRNLIGVGGLPSGTSGHFVTMLSGGFDSPVASFMMAKRGVRQTFAFFYAYPFVGDEVKDKILALTKILGRYQRHGRLFVLPFGDLQKKISDICKEEYRTLLFRKSMIECSNLLADRVEANGILTGDALGQVSSQTIGNITALDMCSKYPIFRPLVGFNKAEIIEKSKIIGTHDTSVIPHDDACALFAPKHPVLSPDLEYWKEFMGEHDLSDDLNQIIDDAEVYIIDAVGEMTEVE
jgi:tRNA uracil 4-sulfurtransferase